MDSSRGLILFKVAYLLQAKKKKRKKMWSDLCGNPFLHKTIKKTECGDKELKQWKRLNQELQEAISQANASQEQVIAFAQPILETSSSTSLQAAVTLFLQNTIATTQQQTIGLLTHYNNLATLIEKKLSKCSPSIGR